MADELKHVHTALKKKFSNKKLIFGSGLVGSKIAIICDAPGPDEDSEKRPIAGHTEKTVNKLLRAIGLNKSKVYFTNVVKYYPAQKIPTAKEIKSYVPFLKEELKTINPRVVVTLGNMALNGIGMRQPLDNVHGKVFNMGSYHLIPTFHPKHMTNDPQIQTLMELDFAKVKNLLAEPEVTS